jgi:uncharacterized membrane protein (DUF373 family)
VDARESQAAEAVFGVAETALYLAAAALLIVAGVLTFIGSVDDLIDGSKGRAIPDNGVFLLDRVLLLFIIAELVYTLRLINHGRRIVVEPFLFIGLIAVVRKVLIVTAETARGHRQVTDFIVQIGGLSGLALVLALAIYLLRRSTVPA